MKQIIPVVVINNLEETDAKMNHLLSMGIMVAEITFRTACASDAIAMAVKNYPQMTIGAGTVINASQAELAIEKGSKFIVSPGFSAGVATVCKAHDIEYIPGCVTPTEIMEALEHGITKLKFFPANVYGGLKALKALSAPFPQVTFVPTGGIDESNMAEYMALDKVVAIGGSFMFKNFNK